MTRSMNSGSYFTNLMSTGSIYSTGCGDDHGQPSQNSDDLHDTQPHDGAAIPKDGPTARKEKKRSRNFSVDEDKLLVSGWLHVSIDPIHGTDQALGTYWARIHKYFHANKNFESDRSQESLMNHWSGIQHDINVFCGSISKIEARNQSGCSIDDKVCEHSLFY
jgi:hypothetical protein